jgi:hypothetical protein
MWRSFRFVSPFGGSDFSGLETQPTVQIRCLEKTWMVVIALLSK